MSTKTRTPKYPAAVAADAGDDEVIEETTGNVFADLGLPDAEERLAKALLARAIEQIIKARGWKQAQAAGVARVAASDMSDIVRGKLAKFSLDRLDTILLNLGVDVEIRLTPVPQMADTTKATKSSKPAKSTAAPKVARRGRMSVALVGVA